MQFESTAAIGRSCRGTATRFTKFALSTSDMVALTQAIAKKLNATSPHNTNRGKFGIDGLGKILVNMKVRTPIITRGFSMDHNTPSDMFRYRTLKSFMTRFDKTKG